MAVNKIADVNVSENLKTLRLLHQIIMIVVAAILAFALRPDRSGEYKDALDELAALREVSFGGWGAFISERYKAEQDSNTKIVKSIIRLSGVPIGGNPRRIPSS